MQRARIALGFSAAAILLLSCAAHMLIGWGALRGQLLAAHAPADLIQALGMGWQLAGVMMAAFALIVIAHFLALARGGRPDAFAVRVIAVLYVVFGSWALIYTHFDPFFLSFLVPGLALAIASTAATRGPERS